MADDAALELNYEFRAAKTLKSLTRLYRSAILGEPPSGNISSDILDLPTPRRHYV
jgi:hypothetical protein